MSRFRKAVVAALIAGAGSAAPFVVSGLTWGGVLVALVVAVAAGLGAAGVANAGFVDFAKLGPVMDLAEATYTRYASRAGLPAWSELDYEARRAFEKALQDSGLEKAAG